METDRADVKGQRVQKGNKVADFSIRRRCQICYNPRAADALSLIQSPHSAILAGAKGGASRNVDMPGHLPGSPSFDGIRFARLAAAIRSEDHDDRIG
jgi:hypothetical protein